jgi:DNA polymerase III gamma/tau subunit
METAWNEIVGHEWAVDLLREAIAHGRVGHAYLFTGPRHVGKTALAVRFAQALNCDAERGPARAGSAATAA